MASNQEKLLPDKHPNPLPGAMADTSTGENDFATEDHLDHQGYGTDTTQIFGGEDSDAPLDALRG
jgi:hypothetical protein